MNSNKPEESSEPILALAREIYVSPEQIALAALIDSFDKYLVFPKGDDIDNSKNV